MRWSLGSRVTLDVLPTKEKLPNGDELLCLSLIINTPWGPLRNVSTVGSKTLRAMLVWVRNNYGMLAYDFVAARPSLADLVPRDLPGKKQGEPQSRRGGAS
jgi:hypothetical protein